MARLTGDAELRLRLLSEELIAGIGADPDRPVAQVVAELERLDAAALALAGAGWLDPKVADRVLVDTTDALVARGADWLVPQVPELDVQVLHAAAAEAGRPAGLDRVIAVRASTDVGTITSLELWSDRSEIRLADGTTQMVGAVARDDRRLEVRDPSGGTVGIDLGGGRRVEPIIARTSSIGVDAYLEHLVWHHTGLVRRDGSLDARNAARQRIDAAAGALDARDGPVLAAFDVAVASTAVPAGDGSLVDVVPIAGRYEGGVVASLERWTDHWRLVVHEDRPSRRALWTAAGGYGGAFVAGFANTVRFDPALPASARAVTVRIIDVGVLTELELSW